MVLCAEGRAGVRAGDLFMRSVGHASKLTLHLAIYKQY